jgi:M6 family metalloprotease-like protein
MSSVWGERLRIAQENGSAVELTVYGDENYAYYENDQGYTTVYDRTLGLFCYGKLERKQDNQGSPVDALVSTGVPITNSPPSGLQTRLMEAANVRRDKILKREAELAHPYVRENLDSRVLTFGPNEGLLKGRQLHKGEVLGLTILVEFQDVPFTGNKEEISRMLNQQGYNGNGNFCSVRDYFLMMSGNKLDYRNDVLGPLKLKHKRGYYYFREQNEVLEEAMSYVEKLGLDLSKFDVDGDGRIDAINIMYAGETQYVDNSWLWPHNAEYELQLGVFRTQYYQICSLESGSIGTFCHENGHMLCRFPDLYDYGSRDGDRVKSAGLGTYCLMSAGNHLNGGRTPAPICGYFRRLAKWCDREILLNRPNVVEIRSCDFNTIMRFTTDKDNEYFIVENRCQQGIDSSCPDSGLAIYHCDTEGSNEWQDGSPGKHYQCALIQADGRKDLEMYENMGDSGDLFSKDAGITVSPPMWDGRDSGLVIREIGPCGEVMSFRVGN